MDNEHTGKDAGDTPYPPPGDTMSFSHEDLDLDPDMELDQILRPRDDSDDLVPGLVIPGYTLVRELSKGGQAVIFLATQNSTGRKVAVKLLLDGPVESQVERTRMDREVRVLAELDHPNIVSIIDRGSTREGLNFFVMEYLKGSILAEYMDEYHAKYPPYGLPEDFSELLRIFVRICETVNAAHLRGIVHRDLKPSNIIIDSYGEPHIFDFGVASGAASWLITEAVDPNDSEAREFLGSLPWASPEQAEGDMSRIDTRTDVYALGVILFEMLTGEFPYEVFGKPVETLYNIRNAVPPPPSRKLAEKVSRMAGMKPRNRFFGQKNRNPIDPTMDAIILKALDKRRDRRYQTAGALAQDITKYVAGQLVSVTGKPPRSAKPGTLLPFLAGAGLLAGAAGTALLILDRPGRGQARQAEEEISALMGENLVGYRLKGQHVIFEFKPSQMETVRLSDGSLGLLSDVKNILSVSVAGPFNNWDPFNADWKLRRTEKDAYALARPLSDFEGHAEWPFKFVVNGSVWVSAPPFADNRVIVPEDAATYNFILRNPNTVMESGNELTTRYRQAINRSWPGVGANLASDGAGRYFLSLHNLPPGMEVSNLEPLRDIPMVQLNLGELVITDFTPLKGMTSLHRLILNHKTYEKLIQGIVRHLARIDFQQARQSAADLTSGYLQVPAFHGFHGLLMDSINVLEELRLRPSAIPSSVRTFEGRSYAYILLPLNWNDAFNNCKKYGAHLATVTSEEELNFLISEFGAASLGRSFWLGGSDQRSEGDWEWVTREPWTFDKWTVNEPNNRDAQEHNLYMQYDGWWYDANGDDTRLPYIMEWDSTPEPGNGEVSTPPPTSP